MRPCTLHGQKTGTIGTMIRNPGTIFSRGGGDLAPLVSKTYLRLGTIGTIGTMFSTYARACARGVRGILGCAAGKQGKVFLRVTLKRSSLSSLSSPKSGFSVSDQGHGFQAFPEKIVPDLRVIVPIVPKKIAGNQDTVVLAMDDTKY